MRRHAGSKVCHVDNDSVLCFGRARVLEDLSERAVALNAFQHALQPGAAALPEKVVKGYLDACAGWLPVEGGMPVMIRDAWPECARLADVYRKLQLEE